MNRRRDPAWRAMFQRLDAKIEADQRAETDRWQGLSDAEKWAEMADAARRWRPLLSGRVIDDTTNQLTTQIRKHILS